MGTLSLSFAGAVKPMAETEDGVMPKHARTRHAHDESDLLAPFGLVTMDRALGAGGLLGPEATAFKAQGGVFQEAAAIRAKSFAVVVLSAAVELDHGGHGAPLAPEPLVASNPQARDFRERSLGGNGKGGFQRHFHRLEYGFRWQSRI